VGMGSADLAGLDTVIAVKKLPPESVNIETEIWNSCSWLSKWIWKFENYFWKAKEIGRRQYFWEHYLEV
jgi:hypothetical protein